MYAPTKTKLLAITLIVFTLTACSGISKAVDPCYNKASYLQQYNPIMSHFIDEGQLGLSVPRMALVPVIEQMQSARRDMEALPATACTANLKALSVVAMDDSIQVYVLFLGGDDTGAQKASEQAGIALSAVTAELQRLNGAATGQQG